MCLFAFFFLSFFFYFFFCFCRSTIFVSDGDGGQNHRVSAFSSGEFQLKWVYGHFGTSNYDFASPHSIAIDQMQRLWVADRNNNRTQLFGQSYVSGPLWLYSWTCLAPHQPWGVSVWRQKSWLLTADGALQELLVSDIQSDRAAKHCNIMESGTDSQSGLRVSSSDI